MKNTLIVALNNLDMINSTHKIDKTKWKSTKPTTVPKVARQINTHDTTSKPIKRVETDIIRQGVPDFDNAFTEKFFVLSG